MKRTGAAGLKPGEVAVEQVAGKKKSKFWVYAVEPIPQAQPQPEVGTSDGEILDGMNRGYSPSTNGYGAQNGHASPLPADQGLFVHSTS